MCIKIGVLGSGAIGAEHIHRIENSLTGGQVVAVYDVNLPHAKEVIADIPHARLMDSAEAVIDDADVDAILITSATFTHEEFCLKAIVAGKPVFVEKPMATTTEGARRIVDAEMAGGKKLVQVGFMRRYDSGYVALKNLVASGGIGMPLVAHCAHRNPTYPTNYENRGVITDTVIHEMQWLMNDYFVKTEVRFPRKTANAAPQLNDPQLVLLTTSSGMIVEVEAFVNCKYGYDVQCEIVGETGIARLPEPASLTIRSDAKLYTNILMDWKDRFIDAYDVELQAWINAVSAGKHSGGPDAWDGYCAAITADACIRAQDSGQVEEIALTERPAFYRQQRV